MWFACNMWWSFITANKPCCNRCGISQWKTSRKEGSMGILPSGDSVTAFIRKYQLHAAILIVSYRLSQHAFRFQLEERSLGWRVGFIFCDIAAWGYVIIGSFFNVVREMAIQVPLPRVKYQVWGNMSHKVSTLHLITARVTDTFMSHFTPNLLLTVPWSCCFIGFALFGLC